MKKNLLIVFVLGILLVSIVSIGAISTVQTNTGNQITSYTVKDVPGDNWLGRIVSGFKFSNLNIKPLTVYGDELGCSKYASKSYTFKKGQQEQVTTSSSAFVDWFRGSPNDGTYSSHPTDSRQFLAEDFVTKSSISWTCDAGAYWNSDCYVDVYDCPNPCYSNSDCTSPQTCDKTVLSQKIPNAGVCRTSNPTHTTQVYRCANGVKTSLGGVTYGNVNFCSSPSDSKYLIGSTDQCLSYQPSDCSSSPCTGGLVKCSDGTCKASCDNTCPTGQTQCSDGTCKENCNPTPFNYTILIVIVAVLLVGFGIYKLVKKK
jgi:hypothetical protein